MEKKVAEIFDARQSRGSNQGPCGWKTIFKDFSQMISFLFQKLQKKKSIKHSMVLLKLSVPKYDTIKTELYKFKLC